MWSPAAPRPMQKIGIVCRPATRDGPSSGTQGQSSTHALSLQTAIRRAVEPATQQVALSKPSSKLGDRDRRNSGRAIIGFDVQRPIHFFHGEKRRGLGANEARG
jgi:hypothetical protein